MIALILSLLLQDQDATVRGLLQQLQDDTIEARDEAARQLVRIGHAAIAPLKQAEGSADPELKLRIRQILIEIDRQERLRSILREPAKVTIQADGTSLREALASLSKQASTEIDASKVPADLVVRYTCREASFWDALDGLCRAHGGVRWHLSKVVHVMPGTYVAVPRIVRGPLIARLTRVEWRRVHSFADGDGGNLALDFELGWEGPNRPGWIDVKVTELVDDKGTDLLEADEAPGTHIEAREKECGFPVFGLMYKEPAEQATKLARLKAEFVIGFPLTHQTAVFPDPLRGESTTQKLGDMTLNLRRFVRRGATILCDLQVPRTMPFETGAVSVIDQEGGTYPLRHFSTSTGGGMSIYGFAGTIPEKTEIRELRYRVIRETHTEILPLELRDIPIR